MDIQAYLDQNCRRINDFLSTAIPDDPAQPVTLYKSVRYSLLGGGKRIRPILAIAAAQAIAPPPPAILPIASSLEMIHTYSLIHDDLPAMDNDDYRRGKLTNHKVFGEAMAILAGDALLTLAFELISHPRISADLEANRLLQITHELALGAGHWGMVGGQVLDIQAENQDVDLSTLQLIHNRKTGRLIRAAVRIGAIVSGATDKQLKWLTEYSEAVGLAFQIADDVLNVTGTREELGKDANTDAKRGKKTYPSFYGIQEARELAEQCVRKAIDCLNTFDHKADPLRAIANFVVSRRN